MLALAGGVLGLLLAVWGVQFLIKLTPTACLERKHNDRSERPGICSVRNAATGVVFGLAPALQASKVDLNDALRKAAAREPAAPALSVCAVCW